MLQIAEGLRPHQVTFVPERRQEITTEGGLAVPSLLRPLGAATARLNALGIRTSLFIDPHPDSVRASLDTGAVAVELHTGAYAHTPGPDELSQLARAASLAAGLGLAVHAGHGLTISNVGPVAAIQEIEELNIGHHIVSRAVIVGFETAVREMLIAVGAHS
jgi:pyridoxine 5-phosphate synthase